MGELQQYSDLMVVAYIGAIIMEVLLPCTNIMQWEEVCWEVIWQDELIDIIAYVVIWGHLSC